MAELPAGSQDGQDRWIIQEVFPGKIGGYFVELGAGDGRYLSNTWLLEKAYGWDGLLIEPSDMFSHLRRHRSACCCPAVIAAERGWVDYVQSERSPELGEDPQHHLSGIQENLDCWHPEGAAQRRYAWTLQDTFAYWATPPVFEFLSLDVEGSELALLRTFPWDAHRPLAIAVEHNYIEPRRGEMRELLLAQGYRLVRSIGYDDCYLHSTLQDVLCH